MTLPLRPQVKISKPFSIACVCIAFACSAVSSSIATIEPKARISVTMLVVDLIVFNTETNSAPNTLARSHRPSLSITSITACAAATAIGLPA